ncbi:hypothetical protein J2S11_000545 [Bacillus horti]|uniref:Uncharacterized protein n=1 Tax=Caldalkalibacillus horti TaxID=77523 RepID=A0ABT9VUT7_9BACI|nr:hypothetical protein [Bacillus horti]
MLFNKYMNRNVTINLDAEVPEIVIDLSNEDFPTEVNLTADYEKDYRDLVKYLKQQDLAYI